jgi:hypothetical protein
VSPERRAFGPAATALGTALKAPFWCALAAEIAWLALSASAEGALSCVLGAKGRALAHLLVLGALAFSSDVLVFLERRANASDDPERLWTLRRRPTRWCSSVRCFSASTPSSAGTTRPDGAAARGAVVSDACPRPRRRPHDALGTIRGAVGKASCHR